MKARSVILCAALLGASVTSGCTHAGGAQPIMISDSAGIAVGGRGEVDVSPDIATFTVGVEVNAKTVAEAREGAAGAAVAMRSVFVKHAIDAKDLQTSQLSVSPRYEYPPSGSPILVGYTVTNTSSVKVRDLSKLSAIVDDAVLAGGDAARVQGIQFDVSDPTAAREKAREQAMTEAKRKAEQLASLSGVGLGATISIEEVSYQPPSFPMMARLEEAGAAKSTPIEPGTSRIAIDVRVRWAIDKG